MALDEEFDFFNEQMIKMGTATRQFVHANGLWHQTFHCWIVNKSIPGRESLLFQLRHKDKETYPGLLDTSCAGHLLTGETAQDGLRELQEELDISVPITDLTYCGMVPEENIISDTCIDREFSQLFIYECDKPLNEYTFQLSEISGLFFVDIQEFKQLLAGDRDFILAEGIVVDETEENPLRVTREVYKEDFAPNSDAYYEMLFDKLQHVLR